MSPPIRVAFTRQRTEGTMKTALIVFGRIAAALVGLASLGLGALLTLLVAADKTQADDGPAIAMMIALTVAFAAFCFVPQIREFILWRHLRRNADQMTMAVDLVRPDRDALDTPADLTDYHEIAWLGAMTQRIAVVSIILVGAVAVSFLASGWAASGFLLVYAVLGFFFPRVIGYFLGAFLVIFAGFAIGGTFRDVPKWAGVPLGLVGILLAALVMRRNVAGALAAAVITSWNAARGIKEPWTVRPKTNAPEA
jgi:hypothetical protein